MVSPHALTGSSSQFPQVWTRGDYRYGVLINVGTANALVFKQHRTTLVTTTFQLETIAGNPLSLPLDDPGDQHYGLAICVDADGYIHIAGNGHTTPLRYVRSTNPEDITSWAEGPYPFSGTGPNKHTYNYFYPLLDGSVLWMVDQEDTVTFSARDVLLSILTPGATLWGSATGLGEIISTEDAADYSGPANRAYHMGMHVTPNGTDQGRIHIAGIWRTASGDPASQQKPFYMFSDDLLLWYGRTYPPEIVEFTNYGQIPLTWDPNFAGSGHGIAEITSAPAYSNTTSTGIAIDADGYPHVVMQVENTVADVELYFDGAAWASRSVARNSVPLDLDGDLYMLVTENGRVVVRHLDSGAEFFLGDKVGLFYPNPDPVARQAGRIEVLIPDGDTPNVYTFKAGGLRLNN